MIKPVLAFVRIEGLDHGMAGRVGVLHKRHRLFPQRAVADGSQPGFQGREDLGLAEIGELLLEALQVAEGVFVDEADEAVEFQQGILQGGGGKQKLVPVLKRLLQDVGYDIVWLVNIPQPVGFINDHQIPFGSLNIRGFVPGELVGTKQDGVCLGLEGPEIALPDSGVVGLGFEDFARQEELFA